MKSTGWTQVDGWKRKALENCTAKTNCSFWLWHWKWFFEGDLWSMIAHKKLQISPEYFYTKGKEILCGNSFETYLCVLKAEKLKLNLDLKLKFYRSIGRISVHYRYLQHQVVRWDFKRNRNTEPIYLYRFIKKTKMMRPRYNFHFHSWNSKIRLQLNFRNFMIN